MDRKLLYSTIILALLGMIMVYSASSVVATSRFGSQLYFIKKQLIWLILGLMLAWVTVKIDLKKLAVYSVPLLLITLVMLALVFQMPPRNGSHRWLFFGPFSIQPSEIYKLAVIIYLAFSLSKAKKNIWSWKQLIFPYGPLIVSALLLIIMQPGLGSAIVITLTVLAMFYLAGVRIMHLAALIAPAVSLAAILVFGMGYKKTRVIDYLSAINDPLTGSYQVKQAVLTLGAGGMTGVGLGDGRQKMFFLPYPHTDFIFASIGEELGFIGLVVIMILFYIIIWRGMKIARVQPDLFGYLLAMGVTISLFVSFVIREQLCWYRYAHRQYF
jgi:cell division protein FtsW